MQEFIEKPATIVPTPNLQDYDETHKTFRWQDAYAKVEWFEDGRLNAACSAVDRHARSERKDKIALYWQGDDEDSKYTFRELSDLSNKFANLLTSSGIEKGDRAFIFLPRIPELYVSFLGILKTGAIAGTMFSAFGTEGLYDRLQDSGARYLITNSELKSRVYEIKDDLPDLEQIIIVDETDVRGGEISYPVEMEKASCTFDVAKMLPDDPAFMLYTSGTTGKPKGVVHRHLAIVGQHATTEWVLDLHEDDIYWCTADPGWVTGISYGLLGPWSCGASVVVHGG
ncbi:MAG: AMP-binding protein, partial [ANME-2 cluster archaeon]